MVFKMLTISQRREHNDQQNLPSEKQDKIPAPRQPRIRFKSLPWSDTRGINAPGDSLGRDQGKVQGRDRSTRTRPSSLTPARSEQPLTFGVLSPGREQKVLDFLDFARLQHKVVFMSCTDTLFLAMT